MDFTNCKKVLVIGAHSDDEVLGVGGTIDVLNKKGVEVDVLIITDSVSAQYQGLKSERDKRFEQLTKSCNILGVSKVTQLDLPDMQLDTLAHMTVNKAIEKYLSENSYDTVFVHHPGDINRDHRVVFESVSIATRPLPDTKIKNILTYYTPSSTEWGAIYTKNNFNPNVFIDISTSIEQKLRAFCQYEKEVREFPHPRSLENIENISKTFGSTVGLNNAEAFSLVRSIS